MVRLDDQLEQLRHPDGYEAVARRILTETILCCREKGSNEVHQFAIEDIEFYQHNDPATLTLPDQMPEQVDVFGHRSPKQKRQGTWYFHGCGKLMLACAEGSYKGLDITFGPPENLCGILLRRIRHLATNKITEGPCRIVDAFLSLTHHVKARDLQQQLEQEARLNIFDEESALYVIEQKVPLHEEGRLSKLWRMPRFGLSFKEVQQGTLKYKFIKAPYRFTHHRPGIGRVHLFCAVLDTLPEEIIKTGDHIRVLNSVTEQLGLVLSSKATLLSWLERYRDGLSYAPGGPDPLRAVAFAHRPGCVAFVFGYIRKFPYIHTANG